MINELQEIVFENLAREVYRTRAAMRVCKNNGHDELAAQAQAHAQGIEMAVIALGFDFDSFESYYKENRKRYREEMESLSLW